MTDAKSPYEVLGITPDATDAAIRAAYRKLAAKLHPDAGGDPVDFAVATKARDFLLDPKKRAAFDEGGRWEDGPSEMNGQVRVMTAISALMEMVMESVADQRRVDIVQEMRNRIETMVAKRTNDIASLQMAKAAVSDMADRFMHRGGGENFLASIARAKLARAERDIANLEAAVKLDQEMLAFLNDYTYLFEKAPKAPTFRMDFSPGRFSSSTTA